jgi:hypothetical protein
MPVYLTNSYDLSPLSASIQKHNACEPFPKSGFGMCLADWPDHNASKSDNQSDLSKDMDLAQYLDQSSIILANIEKAVTAEPRFSLIYCSHNFRHVVIISKCTKLENQLIRIPDFLSNLAASRGWICTNDFSSQGFHKDELLHISCWQLASPKVFLPASIPKVPTAGRIWNEAAEDGKTAVLEPWLERILSSAGSKDIVISNAISMLQTYQQQQVGKLFADSIVISLGEKKELVEGVFKGLMLSEEDADLLLLALQLDCKGQWEQTQILIFGEWVLLLIYWYLCCSLGNLG